MQGVFNSVYEFFDQPNEDEIVDYIEAKLYRPVDMSNNKRFHKLTEALTELNAFWAKHADKELPRTKRLYAALREEHSALHKTFASPEELESAQRDQAETEAREQEKLRLLRPEPDIQHELEVGLAMSATNKNPLYGALGETASAASHVMQDVLGLLKTDEPRTVLDADTERLIPIKATKSKAVEFFENPTARYTDHDLDVIQMEIDEIRKNTLAGVEDPRYDKVSKSPVYKSVTATQAMRDQETDRVHKVIDAVRDSGSSVASDALKAVGAITELTGLGVAAGIVGGKILNNLTENNNLNNEKNMTQSKAARQEALIKNFNQFQSRHGVPRAVDILRGHTVAGEFNSIIDELKLQHPEIANDDALQQWAERPKEKWNQKREREESKVEQELSRNETQMDNETRIEEEQKPAEEQKIEQEPTPIVSAGRPLSDMNIPTSRPTGISSQTGPPPITPSPPRYEDAPTTRAAGMSYISFAESFAPPGTRSDIAVNAMENAQAAIANDSEPDYKRYPFIKHYYDKLVKERDATYNTPLPITPLDTSIYTGVVDKVNMSDAAQAAIARGMLTGITAMGRLGTMSILAANPTGLGYGVAAAMAAGSMTVDALQNIYETDIARTPAERVGVNAAKVFVDSWSQGPVVAAQRSMNALSSLDGGFEKTSQSVVDAFAGAAKGFRGAVKAGDQVDKMQSDYMNWYRRQTAPFALPVGHLPGAPH